MATDQDRKVDGEDKLPSNQRGKYKDINPNRSNDGVSGGPPTNLETEPGVDPDDHTNVK